MELVAYNLNEIQARNILAKVQRADMNVVRDFPCVARVHIESTCFKDEFVGGGEMRRPCLEIIGKADSFFIEPSGDLSKPEQFPFGTSEVSTTSPIDVRVLWMLTCLERSNLEAKGLRTPGFKPPAIMDNNVMEIPMNVNCVGIYGTPCCFIEVVDPMNIVTTTYDNHYVDIFDMCEETPTAIEERQHSGQIIYMTNNEYGLSQSSEAELLGDEPDYIVEEEQVEEVAEPIDRTTEAIREATDEVIKASKAEYENRVQTFDTDSFLAGVQQQLANQNTDAFGNHRDVYGNELNQGNVAMKDQYDIMRQMIEDEEEKKRENARKIDRAADLAALNAGVDDIAGMGTSADIDKIKSEQDAAKARQVSRNADIVSDLATFNAGGTDVAGQGSVANEPKSAQALLAGLFPKKKQAPDLGVSSTPSQPLVDGQQFL